VDDADPVSVVGAVEVADPPLSVGGVDVDVVSVGGVDVDVVSVVGVAVPAFTSPPLETFEPPESVFGLF